MPLNDYQAGCLTNWGAILGVSAGIHVKSPNLLHVHDPQSCDPGGQYIGTDEIQLLWRIKTINP